MHLCGNITLYVQDLNLSFLSCDSMLVQYRADNSKSCVSHMTNL